MQINKISKDEWEKELANSPHKTPFHHYDWFELTARLLDLKFMPLIIKKGTKNWLTPCLIDKKNNIKFSTIGYGGPIPISRVENTNQELIELKNISEKIASKFSAKLVSSSLYPNEDWPDFKENTEQTKSSTIHVATNFNQDYIFTNIISGNCRTAVRKSENEKVEIYEVDSNNLELINESTKILNQTQANVGSSYLTSVEIIKELCKLQSNDIKICLFIAKKSDKNIATSLAVYDDNELFHLFHGWEREYASTCANQALIWHMIKFASNNDLKIFNMGESHTQNLEIAKLRWGGKKVPTLKINYEFK